MSIDLVYYGNETLKQVAHKVENIDGELVDLVKNMFVLMKKESGIGLAAPQIDLPKRIITIDISDYDGTKLSLINPVIKEISQETEPYEEGCLSVPGINRDIIRPMEVLVSGIDLDGNEVEYEADGLLARVFQHEIDHLNGILFIDHLEDYRRNEIRKELKKIKKMNRN